MAERMLSLVNASRDSASMLVFFFKKKGGREALFVCTIASVTSGRLIVLC